MVEPLPSGVIFCPEGLQREQVPEGSVLHLRSGLLIERIQLFLVGKALLENICWLNWMEKALAAGHKA